MPALAALGVELTPEIAEARLRAMVAAADAPALTDPEVTDLLELAKRRDTDGNVPTDAAWNPTWHLASAAAEGWRRKAGKLAGRPDVRADDASVSWGKVREHCLAMARVYGAQGGLVSLPLKGLDGAQGDGFLPFSAPEPDQPGGAWGEWPGGASGGGGETGWNGW